MNVVKITIQTLQANTQQVKKGFWSVTLPASSKVVGNIVKLSNGNYGLTNNMTEHASFMAALGAMLPLFKAAVTAAEPKSSNIAVKAVAAVLACVALSPAVAMAAGSFGNPNDASDYDRAQDVAIIANGQIANHAYDRTQILEQHQIDETTAREAADDGLQTKVDANKADTNQKFTILNGAFSQRARIVDSELSDEATARKAGDDALQSQHDADIRRQARTDDIQTGEIEITNQRIDEDRATIASNKTEQAAVDSAQNGAITDVAAQVQSNADVQSIRDTQQNVRIQKTAQAAEAENMREQLAGSERYQSMKVTAQPTPTPAPAPAPTPAPKNGVDGKDGLNGVTKVETDTATQTQVQTNRKAISSNNTQIRSVRDEQTAQGEFIQRQGAVINQHSRTLSNHETRLNSLEGQTQKNSNDIASNRKAIKRVGAMSQAVAGLHYDANNTGLAVAAGTYDGSQAIAGGAQFNTSERSAATVGISL